MADLGRWFKLWCTAVHDPDLDNLPIEDFGRWAKLGAITKEQGHGGQLKIKPPARAICTALQLADFEAFQCCVSRLPNVCMRRDNSAVSSETTMDVSYILEFCNWLKYQGDFSTDRVRKFRKKNDSMKRAKRRGEEKRSSSVSSYKSGSGSVLKEETNGSISIGSQAKILLDFWSDKYLEKNGQRPEVEGKRDMECAKALMRGRSLDQAKAIVLFHFETPSEFYRERNLYGLHHIRKDCNQIISRMQSGPGLLLPEKTKRNLQAAAQFLQEKKDKPW